jgi:hypothetical protein
MKRVNRWVYYGYPQMYTSFPAPHTTAVEPKFTELLIQHMGLTIVITTTVGKLVGTLEDVSIDHATLVVQGKKHYIRLCEIVYFEKAEEK